MRILELFLSLPKTVWFNLRFLPLRQAVKIPFAIHYKTRCCVRGGVILISSHELKPLMIRIGFHTVPIIHRNKTFIDVKGKLIFEGSAHIGRGSTIVVQKGAFVEIGNNFAISAASNIYCYEHIRLGNNIQFSWGVLLMDSDAHTIYDDDGKVMNANKEIVLGNKIWVSCDVKILKGAFIPDNCVVGANSVVTSSNLESNTLIVGSPAKSVKHILGFKI